jgi:hypothetical protein
MPAALLALLVCTDARQHHPGAPAPAAAHMEVTRPRIACKRRLAARSAASRVRPHCCLRHTRSGYPPLASRAHPRLAHSVRPRLGAPPTRRSRCRPTAARASRAAPLGAGRPLEEAAARGGGGWGWGRFGFRIGTSRPVQEGRKGPDFYGKTSE